MEHDQLNILPANIHDYMRIVVELERRFGMRDGFHQRHVCFEDVFQNVLCVTRRSYPQHFQPRILGFHLLAQVLKHFDGVLDWIAVRELIGLAQNVAFFVQQNSIQNPSSPIVRQQRANGG